MVAVFYMLTSSIINQDALQAQINHEVERLTAIKFEEFKNAFLTELSQNYYFDDRLLSRKETAEKLDISIRTLDMRTNDGKITSIYQGRSVKYRKSDILRYIRNLK